MKTLRTALSLTFRLSGVLLVLLGIYLWTGRGAALASVHMAIGLVFTLAYLGIVALASRSGLSLGPSLLAAGWGFVVPLFGMIQTRLLVGPGHWVIRVIHLLFGVIAMGIADRLVKHSAIIDARRTAEAEGREPMTA